MAIPDNYIDKITNKDSGESRIISPAADKVRVDNENFEGTDLDEVLDEVAQAIDEAGSGDGTVTGVKVGNTTYEPTDGVVDISPAIPDTSGLATKTEVTQGLADKVDKETGYGLSKNDYTDADKTAVGTIPSKANDADVVKSISVNNVAQQKNNGNVNIQVQGTQGKSAYQSYYDTTSDNPKMTEAQWAAAVLRSAYRSYLATTSDNPVMTETQWVASLKGPKGDTGNTQLLDPTTFDPITQIINDLVTGGQTDALSAEMGKELKAQIDALEDEVEELDEGAGYDVGVTETAIVFTSRNMPRVSVGDVGNHNVSCKAGNIATTSFYVSGRKLTSAIQIAVSDPTNWSVSPVSISPTDGKVALTLVTITYHPAPGTASGTTHNCNVVVSSGGTTFGTIAMVGTVAAAPSITLTMSSATITTTQDTPATATLNVKGAALEGDIALAISGTGFTLSTNTVAKADAESSAGADVTVTFDGSANGSATITATSTDAANATASVSGVIPTPLAEGSYFFVPANGGYLRYTVRSNGTVSVGKPASGQNVPSPPSTYNVNPTSTVASPLVIPAAVNDADAAAVYNSSGTRISASGLSYNVTMIAYLGFKQLTGWKAIELPEGLTSIDVDGMRQSGWTKLTLPTTLAIGDNKYAFAGCSGLTEIDFSGSGRIGSYAFYQDTALMKITLRGNPISNSAFSGCSQFQATSGDKPVILCRFTPTEEKPLPQYRANAGVTPFPQNTTTGKVWAKLYVPDIAAYSEKGWNTTVFDEVLDINEYTE